MRFCEAVLKGKFIDLSVSIGKEESYKMKYLTLHLKKVKTKKKTKKPINYMQRK